jgi:hypothetical protein
MGPATPVQPRRDSPTLVGVIAQAAARSISPVSGPAYP